MFRSIHLLAAVGMLAASGCLSGSYDEAYRSSLQRYRQDAQFAQLNKEPHKVADDRLTLRAPKLFKDEDRKGEKERSKPPFLKDFPGFRIAFESLLEAEGTQLPVGLSVGALTDKESGLDEIKKKILSQVQKQATFAKSAWGAAEGPTGPANQASWSILKLRGAQPFDRIVAGNLEKKNTAGETQIWVTADLEAKVAAVLVWRVPEELASKVPLDELAGLVASTVEFQSAAEPAPAAAADPAKAPAPAAAP